MKHHQIHPATALLDLWGPDARWDVSDMDALRAALVARFGPFPLMFFTNGSKVPLAPSAPGLVICDLVDIPGADERPGPFLAARCLGWVPALGEHGRRMREINYVRSKAWDTHTERTTVERPYEGGEPPQDAAIS